MQTKADMTLSRTGASFLIAQFDNMLASINNGDLAIPGEKSDMYDAIADIYTIRGFLEKSLGVKRDYGDPQGQGVFPC